MDSALAWVMLAFGTIVAGVACCRVLIAEHEAYLYKRQHGWQ